MELVHSTDMSEMVVRGMREDDLEEATRIFQLAFGTFLKLPNPMEFARGTGYIAPRWRNFPEGALVAEADGRVVGSNLVSRWGSFGYFGPLTVLPEMWGAKVAQKLLEPTMELFRKWGVRDAGLFTFPTSPLHLALYQKFGFLPGYLTVLLSKKVGKGSESYGKLSRLDENGRASAVAACRALTDSIYAGLDVSSEIRLVMEQGLGDVVLLWDGDRLAGFAVCHCGTGSEAGPGNCYVKFGAAQTEGKFRELMAACEHLTASRELSKLQVGVSTARTRAYQAILGAGFRIVHTGVAMHLGGQAFNREDVFVADDWR